MTDTLHRQGLHIHFSVLKKKVNSDLDDSEAEEPLVQHDDLILVAAVIHDVAQRQQRWHVGQDCAAPHGVALVRNQHLLLVGSDGVVQNHGVLVLVRRGKVILEGSPSLKTLMKM